MSRIVHQKERTGTQIEILYKLATEGSQSVSRLSKKPLNKYRTNTVIAIQVLDDLKFIKLDRKNLGKGGPEKLYKISDKGIELLSKDKRITLTQFWNLVFLIYDAKIIKTKIPLKRFFYNYEKNVLGFELDKVSLRWGFVFQHLFEINGWPVKLNMQIFILYVIGISKKIEYQELLKKIKRRYKVQNEKIDHAIKNLIDSKWIQSKQANSDYYQLSIMGFVLVINYFDSVYRHEEDPKKIKDYDKNLKTIIENSKEIIPLISKICSEIPYLIRSKTILHYFQLIYRQTLFGLNPIQNGGTEEIVYFSRVMDKVRRDKISEYCNFGYSVWKQLIAQNKIKNNDSNAVQKMKYLAHISGMKIENDTETIKNVRGLNFSLDEIIEKSLTERITFEFFCYLLFDVNYWKKHDSNFKQKNELEDFYGNRLENWERFLKTTPEIKILFDSKIKEIKEFEKENLEKLETFYL